MKALLILLLSSPFLSSFVFSQNIYYPNLFVQPEKVENGTYKGYDKYVIGDLTLYNSIRRKENMLIVINESKGTGIFSFEDTNKSTKKLIPHFFKSNGEDAPLVITISSMAKYSLGTSVFLIKGGIAYESGFIHYSLDDYNFSSLGSNCFVHEKIGQIIMSFEDVTIIDLASKKVIPGESIDFWINEESILIVEN